ncbi:hypothetical protein [Paludibacterium yongneupense]|uniref:hypothetical protein n=1 Tax=Paludibacterium yongneupense TaxID=400061 RepID=UPI000413909B|nr:hypothetical protein [Paludibacterium yongneupense]
MPVYHSGRGVRPVIAGLAVLLPAVLAACAQLAPAGGAACAGHVVVPYGMAEVSNADLLQQAVQAPGKGGLCEGKVLRVQQPLTVYRVWDSASRSSQYGRWWSFAPPAGPVAAYRAENAICPGWSALNTVKQCRLKVGAEIVVGPGQSAQCGGAASYPASPVNQVFIPNDTRDPANIKLGVADCLDDVAWP